MKWLDSKRNISSVLGFGACVHLDACVCVSLFVWLYEYVCLPFKSTKGTSTDRFSFRKLLRFLLQAFQLSSRGPPMSPASLVFDPRTTPVNHDSVSKSARYCPHHALHTSIKILLAHPKRHWATISFDGRDEVKLVLPHGSITILLPHPEESCLSTEDFL